MFISTIILILWAVVFIVGGEPLFEWWWIIISYVVEIICYFGFFILGSLIFGR